MSLRVVANPRPRFAGVIPTRTFANVMLIIDGLVVENVETPNCVAPVTPTEDNRPKVVVPAIRILYFVGKVPM